MLSNRSHTILYDEINSSRGAASDRANDPNLCVRIHVSLEKLA